MVGINTATSKSTPMVIKGTAYTITGGLRILSDTITSAFDSPSLALALGHRDHAQAQEEREIFGDREAHGLPMGIRTMTPMGGSQMASDLHS
jgi:hypothetical protein